MQKSKLIWLALICIAAAAALPDVARAQGFMSQPQELSSDPTPITMQSPITLDSSVPQPFSPIAADGTVCPVASGIANRIVVCIHDTVLWAVEAFLIPFSTIMSYTVGAACTLAVVVFGLGVMTGRSHRPAADLIVFGIKLIAVCIFSWNFGGWFPTVIAVMDNLVQTATTYVIYSQTMSCAASLGPWERVDCVLDRLIGGILPSADPSIPASSLATGVLGFLVGCIFSGPAGIGLFLTGIAFFMIIMVALFKSIYIYLNCFIGLCFMACISPLIMPCLLFKVTHQYFEKWLRLFIGLIIQPMVMFTYLSMLLAAMDIVVFSGPLSLFADVAGAQALQPGFQMGNYINGIGAYTQRTQMPMSFNLDSRELAAGLGANVNGAEPVVDMGLMGALVKWQNGLTNQVQEMANKNIGAKINVQTLDMQVMASAYYGVPVSCDTNPQLNCNLLTSYTIQIALATLTAGVMAYIFYIMLEQIPYIAAALSGGMNKPGVLGLPDFGKKMEEGISKGVAGAQKHISGGKPVGAEGRQRKIDDIMGLG